MIADQSDMSDDAENTPGAGGPHRHRVVMIEDHGMVAAALGGVLRAEPDLDLVAIATSLAEAAEVVTRQRPDVVVTDLHLTDGVATDHLDVLRASSPGSRVMILTGCPTEKALLDALDGGATGFVDKSQPIEEFVQAVRRVAGGELVVSPALAPVLLARVGGGRHHDHASLTRRELEVLEMLARGASTDAIATAMCLSAHTVRNHIARVLMKLRAHSRLEAVSEGSRRGLISAW